MSSYTIDTKMVADTRPQKQLERSNIAKNLGVFNKTIIPLVLVGYDIVIAISYPTRAREIIVNFCSCYSATSIWLLTIVKHNRLFLWLSSISEPFLHTNTCSVTE